MAFATSRQVLIHTKTQFLSAQSQPISSSLAFITITPLNGNPQFQNEFPRLCSFVSGHRNSPVPVKSSPRKDGAVSTAADEEGISLGTMKLSLDTNIPRFEILLFQWANSLNQGAQLPLPCPMKVDKIEGGVRLGFVSIDDGKATVEVYIDCMVIPGSNGSDGHLFRAIRKGVQKEKVPPGEPRIMKSLLAALKTSAELARTS